MKVICDKIEEGKTFLAWHISFFNSSLKELYFVLFVEEGWKTDSKKSSDDIKSFLSTFCWLNISYIFAIKLIMFSKTLIIH